MKTEKIYYGAAYYDEYMPYDRIETDMEMMKRAGMNLIRIAESTWSTWEPQEGQFDFTHLHRMLDAAERYGISVIVGTPTYAIPSWLAKKADDILIDSHDGPQTYGRRQIMDITNPIYLEHAKLLIEKLMEQTAEWTPPAVQNAPAARGGPAPRTRIFFRSVSRDWFCPV